MCCIRRIPVLLGRMARSGSCGGSIGVGGSAVRGSMVRGSMVRGLGLGGAEAPRIGAWQIGSTGGLTDWHRQVMTTPPLVYDGASSV